MYFMYRAQCCLQYSLIEGVVAPNTSQDDLPASVSIQDVTYNTVYVCYATHSSFQAVLQMHYPLQEWSDISISVYVHIVPVITVCEIWAYVRICTCVG